MNDRIGTKGSTLSLVALLLSVAIIALLFTKEYLEPRPDAQMTEVRAEISTGTPPTTSLGAARADIESAKAIQTQLNLHNMDINNTLGE